MDERTSTLSREYALFCHGRFVSQARGEQKFGESFSPMSFATAMEGTKSNALTRCCKDLGIGSELWDPNFISKWKKEHAVEVLCMNSRTKEKRNLWRRKDRRFEAPWIEISEK